MLELGREKKKGSRYLREDPRYRIWTRSVDWFKFYVRRRSQTHTHTHIQRERERGGGSEWVSVCVSEWVSEWVSVWVCVFVYVSEFVYMLSHVDKARMCSAKELVCVCACVCVFVSECVSVCVCLCEWVCLWWWAMLIKRKCVRLRNECVFLCVYVCVCVRAWVCKCVFLSIWVSVCVFIYVSEWLSVFVMRSNVDKAWICSAEVFLELYRKIEVVIRNCLLRWSGHQFEVRKDRGGGQEMTAEVIRAPVWGTERWRRWSGIVCWVDQGICLRYIVPTCSISVSALSILAFFMLRQEHFSAGIII